MKGLVHLFACLAVILFIGSSATEAICNPDGDAGGCGKNVQMAEQQPGAPKQEHAQEHRVRRAASLDFDGEKPELPKHSNVREETTPRRMRRQLPGGVPVPPVPGPSDMMPPSI